MPEERAHGCPEHRAQQEPGSLPFAREKHGGEDHTGDSQGGDRCEGKTVA